MVGAIIIFILLFILVAAVAYAVIMIAVSDFVNQIVTESLDWQSLTTEQLEKTLETGEVEIDSSACQPLVPGVVDAEPIPPWSGVPITDHHRATITEILAKRRQATP